MSRNSGKYFNMNRILFSLFFLAFMVSCNHNPLKVDVSDIETNFQFKSFDDDMFNGSEDINERLAMLEEKYPDFLPIFSYEMIQVGGPSDSAYVDLMNSFIQDTLIQNLKRMADEVIPKEEIKNNLDEAFKYYHYYFPEKVVPTVNTCISGFNQSIVMTDSLVGISLDKYLGADCEYYPQLGIPKYKTRNMQPEKIVPDVMYAWGMGEFPIDEDAMYLIDHMIYQGKLMYFMDAMLPETPDTLKIGFSQEQLDFCINREAEMWAYLAEYNLLYSTERMDVKRYVDDAPYTSSFTSDSPGRTGVWLGWQIVKAYMNKNKNVGLDELMLNNDYQSILNNSGYQPEN